MLLGMKSRRVLAVAVVLTSMMSLAVGGRAKPPSSPPRAQAAASLPAGAQATAQTEGAR